VGSEHVRRDRERDGIDDVDGQADEGLDDPLVTRQCQRRRGVDKERQRSRVEAEPGPEWPGNDGGKDQCVDELSPNGRRWRSS
jgi:hypothetical protein